MMLKAAGCSPRCVFWAVPSRVLHFCAKQMSSTTTLNACPICLPFTAGLSCFPAPRIEEGRQCQVQAETALACWTLPGSPGGVCPSLAKPLHAAKVDKGIERALGNREATGLGHPSRGAAGTELPIADRRCLFHSEFWDVRSHWITAARCPAFHPPRSSPHLLPGEISSWGCVCRA